MVEPAEPAQRSRVPRRHFHRIRFSSSGRCIRGSPDFCRPPDHLVVIGSPVTDYFLRWIADLISPIALAGFKPFGQVLVQFMIVWQRYSLKVSSSSSSLSSVA